MDCCRTDESTADSDFSAGEKAVLSISYMAIIFPAGKRRNPGGIYPATIPQLHDFLNTTAHSIN